MTEPTKEIASEILGRYYHLEKDRIKLEHQIYVLTQDLYQVRQWLHEIHQEAREQEVELI